MEFFGYQNTPGSMSESALLAEKIQTVFKTIKCKHNLVSQFESSPKLTKCERCLMSPDEDSSEKVKGSSEKGLENKRHIKLSAGLCLNQWLWRVLTSV